MSINTTLNYSPNFDKKKRKLKQIKFIIFHYTGMRNEKNAIKRLTNSKSKVSSNYLIKNNGNVITLKIDKDGRVAGNITIDMQSILVEDLKGRSKEALENHLKSDDFFGTNNFPTATLEFRSLNRYDNDGGQIFNGNLTIKGISNEVEFSAKLIKQTPLLHAVGKLVFDRSKYNVRFRSGSFFDDLGDKLILDDIEVDINLIAKPA